MADKPKADKPEPIKVPELSEAEREAKAQELERQAAELRKPKPVEFPKHVRSKKDGSVREFASRAAQDAAGPEFAD